MVEKNGSNKRTKQPNKLIWILLALNNSEGTLVRLMLWLSLWVEEIHSRNSCPHVLPWQMALTRYKRKVTESPTSEEREVKVMKPIKYRIMWGLFLPYWTCLSLFRPAHVDFHSHSPPFPKQDFCPHSLTSPFLPGTKLKNISVSLCLVPKARLIIRPPLSFIWAHFDH